MEGMETLRKRKDLRANGQKQQMKGRVEREARRKQHVSVVMMWCGSLLYRHFKLELYLTIFILGMKCGRRASFAWGTTHLPSTSLTQGITSLRCSCSELSSVAVFCRCSSAPDTEEGAWLRNPSPCPLSSWP